MSATNNQSKQMRGWELRNDNEKSRVDNCVKLLFKNKFVKFRNNN